jgi:hypothetical protein
MHGATIKVNAVAVYATIIGAGLDMLLLIF